MCQSEKDERVSRPSGRGRGRLAAIAAALDVPVESFFGQAEAIPGGDRELPSRSERDQLVALYLSLDKPNRSVVLEMMRRLAAKIPEI